MSNDNNEQDEHFTHTKFKDMPNKFKTSGVLGLKEHETNITSKQMLKKVSVKFKLPDKCFTTNLKSKNSPRKKYGTMTSIRFRNDKHMNLFKKFTTTKTLKSLSNEKEISDNNSSGDVLSVFSPVDNDNDICNDIFSQFSLKSIKTEKGYMMKYSKELELLFEQAIKDFFIDSIFNLVEHYEEYLIQNLKVINRMQFLFNEDIYDKLFKSAMISFHKDYKLNYNETYLILDLDETLIHSELFLGTKNYDKIAEFQTEDQIEKVGVFIRPYAYEFLDWVSQHFRLILFTAAEYKYAKEILRVCEFEKYFELVLDRNYTIEIKNFNIKDLSIFNMNEKLNCLILDNNIFSFAASLEQGILISSFIDDKGDMELKDVQDYLEEYIIGKKDDMIQINNEYYMYKDIMQSINFEAKLGETNENEQENDS